MNFCYLLLLTFMESFFLLLNTSRRFDPLHETHHNQCCFTETFIDKLLLHTGIFHLSFALYHITGVSRDFLISCIGLHSSVLEGFKLKLHNTRSLSVNNSLVWLGGNPILNWAPKPITPYSLYFWKPVVFAYPCVGKLDCAFNPPISNACKFTSYSPPSRSKEIK